MISQNRGRNRQRIDSEMEDPHGKALTEEDVLSS